MERYALYQAPGPLLRLFLPSGTRLWHGTITHPPWPVRRARLTAWQGFAAKLGVLNAAGLAELTTGAFIAHASSGVGPVEFFWRGGAA